MDDNQGQDNVFVLLKSFSHYSTKKWTSISKLKKKLANVKPKLVMNLERVSLFSMQTTFSGQRLRSVSGLDFKLIEIDSKFVTLQEAVVNFKNNIHCHVWLQNGLVAAGRTSVKVNVYDPRNSEKEIFSTESTLTGNYTGWACQIKQLVAYKNILYFVSNEGQLISVDTSAWDQTSKTQNFLEKPMSEFGSNISDLIVVDGKPTIIKENGLVQNARNTIQIEHENCKWRYIIQLNRKLLCLGNEVKGITGRGTVFHLVSKELSESVFVCTLNDSSNIANIHAVQKYDHWVLLLNYVSYVEIRLLEKNNLVHLGRFFEKETKSVGSCACKSSFYVGDQDGKLYQIPLNDL